MPFTKHIIQPINISQCPLPPGEPNELECLSNLSLANVIRQLSSLGQHAGRIFDELSKEASQLNNRGLIMHQRIENLKMKCLQLDIQSEEVTLADFQTKKQFKSSIKIDQKVVSRKTMPEAMKIMYNNADPPPALDKLNPYRTDGRDCMKFYTDPEFFFNIWCNELIKDNETRKIEKKRRKTKGQQNTQPNAQPNMKLQQVQKISNPILNKQQQVQYEDPYHQQQLLLMNQNNLKNNPTKPQYNLQQQPKPQYFINEFDDQSLPPPPIQKLNPPVFDCEIYAETNHKINNVTLGRNPNRTCSQPTVPGQSNNKIYSSERPVLPPPPIPTQNHLSDLQQIQQQMIRKKQTDYDTNINLNGNTQHENEANNCDLPPPPSPPNMTEQINGATTTNTSNHTQYNFQQSITTTSSQQLMNKISINDKNLDSTDFDMPLPPPPIDLQEPYINSLPPPLPATHQNSHNNMTQSTLLPPPPPLPPLVESDTVSTSSSTSINNLPVSKSANSSKIDENQVARSSYLDDINQRRFQLKSSKKETNNSNGNSSVNVSDSKDSADTIQPFVNNSDVAAIIDFIRKFRPHVRDSSEEDEENSDWDD